MLHHATFCYFFCYEKRGFVALLPDFAVLISMLSQLAIAPETLYKLATGKRLGDVN